MSGAFQEVGFGVIAIGKGYRDRYSDAHRGAIGQSKGLRDRVHDPVQH